MTEKIIVKAYAEVTFRLSQIQEIEMSEFQEWLEECGEVLTEIESDDVLRFLLQAYDRDEVLASFGRVDPDRDEVSESEVTELEILEIK